MSLVHSEQYEAHAAAAARSKARKSVSESYDPDLLTIKGPVEGVMFALMMGLVWLSAESQRGVDRLKSFAKSRAKLVKF